MTIPKQERMNRACKRAYEAVTRQQKVQEWDTLKSHSDLYSNLTVPQEARLKELEEELWPY